MARLKKNQMGQIIFPIVDGTDFATIESGITASDFESKMTKKFFGVNHGTSTAFTSGTISKAATLVRSGLFAQTLKASETNYDYVVYSFWPANTSLAQVILQFETVDYDDSDIMSRLSDIGSDLLSYLAGMSGAISDIDSQLTVTDATLSDFYSDFQSRVPKAVATQSLLSDVNSNLLSYLAGVSNTLSTVYELVSDVDSQLTVTDATLSDFLSDFQSRVPKAVATQSLLSDVNSNLLSYLAGVSNTLSTVYELVSDVDSQLTVTDAALSDLNSNILSRVPGIVTTFSQMSNYHSDLRSQISGIGGGTASNIASVVWATAQAGNQTAGTFGSLAVATYNLASDVDSQLTVTDATLSDLNSNILSRVPGVITTFSQMSNYHSDLRSQISGIGGGTASNIASVVWNTAWAPLSAAGTFGSLMELMSSRISDIDSQLTVTDATLSDLNSNILSRVPGIVTTFSQMSNYHSDLRSQISGIGGGTASNIASVVWATAQTGNQTAGTFGSLAVANYNLVSDVDSQLTLNYNLISDVQSALDSQFAWTSNYLSGLSGLLSNVESQLDETDQGLFISRGTAQAGNVNAITLAAGEASTNSLYNDMTIALVAGTGVGQVRPVINYVGATKIATVNPNWETAPASGTSYVLRTNFIGHSHIELIDQTLSDFYSNWQSRVPKEVASKSLLSDVDSNLLSYLAGISGAISDVDSQLTVTDAALSNAESNILSYLAGMSGAISDVDSQLTLNYNLISDVESALDSQFAWESNYLSGMSGAISDIDSQLTVTDASLSNAESNILSYLAGMSGAISDVESAVDAIWTTAITEAYAADGAAATPAQLLYMLWANTAEFAISGTTITVKKLDGSTTAMTFTLDDGTNPTSRTRAT